MTSKRALVVDDSRSARAFLSRILERHEITVDAAESAEAAIEYLARNKPDVIFMDHMMPGMDGFQAVQTIKNNPRTSSIPILMYTSQEGDLYLGQARALGAEGVLPKQIKQADVTRMLYQLRLVEDRRGEEQITFARTAQSPGLLPANESAIVVSSPSEPAADVGGTAGVVGNADVAQLLPQMSLEIRAALDGPLQKEIAALRSFISTALDSQTERLHGDIAALVPVIPVAQVEAPPMIPERRPWAAITGWSLALLAIAGAAVVGWMWWQQGSEIAALRADLAASYAEVETLRARPVVVSPPVADETPGIPVDAAVADPAGLVPADDLTATPSATEPAPSVPTSVPAGTPSAAAAPAAVSPAAAPVTPAGAQATPASAPATNSQGVSAVVVPSAQAQ
jgi:CheY-like chemotaxis protein